VAYGQSPAYETGTVNDGAFLTGHTVTLAGLLAGRRYHFQITAVDKDGNAVTSKDMSFRTFGLSTIKSDDFNAFALDTKLWTFIDPAGDATLALNGAQLALTVPAGISHDVWTAGNQAPRIMQPANDTDFEIEVKLDSAVNTRHQLQGVLIAENDKNFLRFNIESDGSQTRIFAASFSNGSPIVKNNRAIPKGVPLYLRIKREKDQWTQSYSYDGRSWVTSVSFEHILIATSMGVFVGNAGNPAPMHTGVIDYFYNTAAPISDKTAPVISDIQVTPGDTTATITWTTNEPAHSRVAHGRTAAYENGIIEDSTLVTKHTITLIGLATGTLYHYQISSVDSSGNATKSPDLTFNTAGPISSVEVSESVPTHFELRQNYPNPFNPTTPIEFSLPVPGFVTLKIFTITGEEVAEPVAEALTASRYKTEWNATGFPSGVYFYRLSVGSFGKKASFIATEKLLLLK
jgi:regulation of enolase protein 1 (concanavalin A-like superfamily)